MQKRMINLNRGYEDKQIRERKGELPECPALNLKTQELEFLDPNDETLSWENYRPLSDIYC